MRWDAIERAFSRVAGRLLTAVGQRVMPPDFDAADRRLIRAVRSRTLTSPERLQALIRATEHVVRAGVEGSIVECGVWRGGSMMAVASTLLRLGCRDRDLHLFDTFAGMTPPEERDRSLFGEVAQSVFRRKDGGATGSGWLGAGIDDVREGLAETGYPASRLHFVRGKVEDTIPRRAPESIALLRLDTDWYRSTRHELAHLYPRLARGGVLIVDDYGHWEGCRQAVDENLRENDLQLLLHRIDYTGRIAVKP